MEGEWSCYTIMGWRMVMLKKWCLMEGAWSCYRGGSQFKGGNDHVTAVVSLMDGEWSCYGGGQFNLGRIAMLQFNGGRMVMLQRWPF